MSEAIAAEVTSNEASPETQRDASDAAQGVLDGAGRGGQAPTEVDGGGASSSVPRDESGKFRQTSPAEKRLHKLKVNGAEVEVPEEELIESGKTAAQIRRAAQQQFEEARRMRAEAEALRKRAAEDPESALAELLGGQDKLDALAEARCMRRLQLEQASPEARARIEAEQRAIAAEKRAKELESQALTEKQAAMQREFAAQFDATFTEALETSGLPKTPGTVARMASMALQMHRRGLDLNPKQIAALVRQDYQAEALAVLGALDGPRLLALMGDEFAKRFRAADVARLKQGQPGQPPAPAPKAQPKPEPEKADGFDPDTWRERIFARAGVK